MKKYFNLGNWILEVTFVFWILETIIFLILQGWHLKATTHAEKICDLVANAGFIVSFALFFVAFSRTTKYMIELFELLGKDIKEKYSS